MLKYLVLGVTALTLTACSGLFDKDNTPQPKALVEFKAEIKPRQLWSVSTGSGVGDESLKISPAINNGVIYTSSYKGVVTAINQANGSRRWQVGTDLALSSGPGAGDGIVVLGSRHGDIIALREADGSVAWKKTIKGEIIANPAVSSGIVIIKAVDGRLHALSANDGHDLWTEQQVEPSLILRGSSSPIIQNGDVIAGFANGNLLKLNLRNGQLYWLQALATPEGPFAIQRMIDIDADPIVYDHRIYAATFQGQIASLDWSTGRTLWSHDLSSYTGMVADDNKVFVTDARSHVWSFDANSGLVNWRQTQLEARNISGPAEMGNYVVVGDKEGYLHWMDKRDGHFVAREYVGAGIYASPIVDKNVLYAQTVNGNLVAYSY